MSLRADGLLLDLDGTVYVGDRAIPGAAGALAAPRRRGVPFRFTTNTTRRPRSHLAQRLCAMGIEARPAEILSAPAAAADWLRARRLRRLHPLLADATGREDFADFILDDLRTGKYRPEDEARARAAADVLLDLRPAGLDRSFLKPQLKLILSRPIASFTLPSASDDVRKRTR